MSKVTGSSNCEEIINILYNLVGPMLGSHDCVKCISQNDTDVYTADVVTLLSSLEIEAACVELLVEALHSHKQQYKRGTKSLLFIVTRLAKSVFLLEQWGISPAFAVRVIQKNILELTEAVDHLATVISENKTHHRDPGNQILNKGNFFQGPCYKNNESECANQCQSLLNNGWTSKKQTVFPHSQEVQDFRLDGKIDLKNVESDQNLVNNLAGDVGKTSLHSLNKTSESLVSQTEDINSEAADWLPFYQETPNNSSEISRYAPEEIKENLALRVSILSHTSQDTSKSEPVCEHNSTEVISMDINNTSSCSPSALINFQKIDSRPTSFNESTLTSLHVDKYSHIVSSSSSLCKKSKSETLAFSKNLQMSAVAVENDVLGNHLTLLSLNQILKKVGTPKLKISVANASRHLRHNLASECSDQDFSAQHATVVDLSHKGKECQKLGSHSEKSLKKSVLNQNCSYQSYFPDELCCLDSCHLEIMDIVKQVYLGQIMATKEKCFNPKLVDCLHVPVSLLSSKKTFLTATTASLYQGLIIVACNSADLALSNLKGDLSTLLINADLTPSYHHIGYKPTLSRTTLVTTISDSTADNLAWERNVIEIFKQLKISLILVRGQASDKLIAMCFEIGIYILTYVPFKTMSILANYFHVDILTYLEQSSTASVFTLSLEPLAEVLPHQHAARKKNMRELYLHVSNSPVIQTVLLSSSCAMSSQLIEERFWKCLYSVSNALSDGKMLPGAGETEHWCADWLKTKSAILLTQSSIESMESVVVESLADVFVDFSDRVKKNCLLTSGASAVAVNSLHPDYKSPGSISHSCSETFSTEKHTYSLSSQGLSKQLSESAKDDFVAADHLTCASDNKVSDPLCDTVGTKLIHYDNYQSKLALWETAVDVVCLLISIGSSVCTGVSSELADF